MEQSSKKMIKDIGSLFASFKINIFFLSCFVASGADSLVRNFLNWYVEDLANFNETCEKNDKIKTLQGLSLLIQSFGQIIMFYVSGLVIKKVGFRNAMNIVLIEISIRFFWYASIKNPWFILPVEIMHGMGFALLYSVATQYCKYLAPPGTEATLQVHTYYSLTLM